MYQGLGPRNINGAWLSSDRPPLQTGIVLIQKFLELRFGSITHYQVIGTISQCIWIPAVWGMCRQFNISSRKIAITFLFLIFNGFFY